MTASLVLTLEVYTHFKKSSLNQKTLLANLQPENLLRSV